MLRHFFDLCTKLLNFRFLLIQKAFLLFDLFGIDDDFFPGDQAVVKAALLIVTAIAVIHPLDKFKQAFQRSQCVSGSNAALRMYCQIAQFDHKGQLSPGIGIQSKTEGGLMN